MPEPKRICRADELIEKAGMDVTLRFAAKAALKALVRPIKAINTKAGDLRPADRFRRCAKRNERLGSAQ
ncbi:MAG: hypothetical protein ACREDJ_09365, partial [Methylocella sp.]